MINYSFISFTYDHFMTDILKKVMSSLIKIFHCVVIQEGERKRSKSVAVIRLSLCQPLSHQVVQVRADECFHTSVAEGFGYTTQHL